MIEPRNLQDLRDALSVKEEKKSLKHAINKRSSFLPFVTRGTERPKFKEGFDGVLGGFTRQISGMQLNQRLNNGELIKQMSMNVNVEDRDKQYLEQILSMFLLDNGGSLKVFHPYMFQYLPFSESVESKGEQEISRFLADVFIEGDNEFKGFFQNTHSDDLISKLVLTNLGGLEEKNTELKYRTKLNHITKIFKEDFRYLFSHEDYFKNHYALFLSYYYFFYITQITLKFSQKTKGDLYYNNEVFYTLDWEPTSKSRKGYAFGYQTIKDASKNLLIDINVLEHLNILFGVNNSQSYPELKATYENSSEEKQGVLKRMIREWMQEYRSILSLTNNSIDENLEYDELVMELFKSIQETYEKSTMQGPQSRYPLSIDEVGKKYFMKTRGSLGYMLNASQDLLLLMTALSLKDERKSLKQVFVELELRGLYFDKYSKEEIVALFDKLNLLDKKSDSGDAQYVKPIL
ncbi:DNA phosphorothioation-dependent restriction protein DptG [Oceanobacillus polygoni]|uniref:DNA phosphorothioation-dependent restriction protein DptG n=1 Tax=Oceanobacillus polygoni TaxID=1235259 RepID=A0A9X0YVY0_9BACI|nr:DNA phosphorothioation-dependent restriction protein DptG [Oceanobacillus polygoni]MBP2079462.1 DNA phosphorothioation-dependent restriction protein DptG [Oceanobacillus polygoni]